MEHSTKAIHALIAAIGLAFLLASCGTSGACTQNGFAGYGTKFHTEHGAKRKLL